MGDSAAWSVCCHTSSSGLQPDCCRVQLCNALGYFCFAAGHFPFSILMLLTYTAHTQLPLLLLAVILSVTAHH